MKKIGRGWQYTVYDIGNNRVLKKQNTYIQTFWQIFFYRFPFNIKRAFRGNYKMIRHANESIAFLRTSIIPSQYLANPKFLSDNSYEQDKVVPINIYFKKHNLDQNKLVIHRYIELCFIFWEYGFGDVPFKLNKNYGVNSNGEVVLFDLGELYFTKEKALERVNSKHWYKTNIKDNKVKEYYVHLMDTFFTKDSVEKHWGIRL